MNAVSLEQIADQNAKGWPDFDPEDYCHRCGGRNLTWCVASPLWNAARIEADTPGGIICPACFEAAFRAAVPSPLGPDVGVAWELKPDPDTLHHLPAGLRAEEAAWRDAYESGRLSEYHAELEADNER